MGRKKLEIKRIENKKSRQVTFVKRRNGLTKKAKELSVLCDVKIAVIVCSNRGKLYDFSSSTNSLEDMLKQYRSHVEVEENGSTGVGSIEENNLENISLLPIKELIETVERDLEEPNADQINLTDLLHLENQLQTALIQTRSRKTLLLMDSIERLHETEKMLGDENKDLQKTMTTKINGGMNEMMAEVGPVALDSLIISGQQQSCKNPDKDGAAGLLRDLTGKWFFGSQEIIPYATNLQAELWHQHCCSDRDQETSDYVRFSESQLSQIIALQRF